MFGSQSILLALAILLATLLAYIPAMQAGFIWDDDAYVTENPVIKSAEGLGKIWLEPRSTPQYYPLVFTTFWLEYRIWGLNPAGYHIVNVLLHALASILLWRVLIKLNVPWAFFAAMVFALHPVHVESVAWITERKNVLSALFFLTSGLCLVRYYGLGGDGGEKGKWSLYGCGLLFFVCALLSKTVVCSLPAVMALLLWWKRGSVSRSEWFSLAPMFALGLAGGLSTAWLEMHHVGAEGHEWELSLLERVLVAGRALWFYAAKIAFPVGLVFNYPRWEVNHQVWWQYIYPASALCVIAWLWLLRRKLGRGPLAGVLFFCGVLFPALGFFDVYPFRFSFVADHFQYHASMGLIALAAGAAGRLWSKLPQSSARVTKLLVTAPILVFLGLGTAAQSRNYSDLETLWRATLKENPEAWLAHNNLGNLLSRQGRFEEAIFHHRQALKSRPDREVTLNNLGFVMMQWGRYGEAEEELSEAIRLRPGYAEAHYNLGLLKSRQGMKDEAVRHYLRALQSRPDYAEARTNLGLLMMQMGRKEEALSHLRAAVRSKSDLLEARMALGRVLAAEGDLNEAAEHFAAALSVSPDLGEAHFHLGLALGLKRDFEEATKHLVEAIRLNPDFAEARMRLTQTYWLKGDRIAAMGELDELRRLSPRHADELVQWMETANLKQ